MATGVALVLGGTQAVSRAVTGGADSRGPGSKVLWVFQFVRQGNQLHGMFFFGLIVAVTGSSRLAIVNLLVFFVIGLVLVWQIDLNRNTKSKAKATVQHRS